MAQKKYAPNAKVDRAMSEKITDGIRKIFEKITGYVETHDLALRDDVLTASQQKGPFVHLELDLPFRFSLGPSCLDFGRMGSSSQQRRR